LCVRFDVLVSGGTVVIPGQGEVRASLGIQDGKIAAILGPEVEADADEVIEARDKVVLPGLIDPHTHTVRKGPPFYQYEPESRSAAIGGVTTFFNYIRRNAPLDEHFEAERTAAEQVAHVDFAFHFGALTDEQIADVPRYTQACGVTSFKYHLNYRFRNGKVNDLGYGSVDDGMLYELLSVSAQHPGTVVNVHAENEELTYRLEHRVHESGMDGQAAWNAARPPFVEGIAVHTACRLAEVTGGTLYVVHMSTRDGLNEVRRARQHGARRIFVETCPQYFTLHVDNVRRPSAKVPPIRTQDHAEAVWAAILDGTIDTLATDHGGNPKKGGDPPSIWEVGPSFPGMSTLLPLLVTEGVHKRGLSLKRVAELTSYNTARIFNLYPRKGTIQPGSDADLVIVDLDAERVVDSSRLESEAGFSLWDGWTLRGWPQRTLVRGKTVMLDGRIVGEKGHGRYQPRQLANAVRREGVAV
jgi:dihydropyrimidinase